MSDTNRTVAQLFVSMADLLAARGENPHRIRAYRRAAESLLALTEDVGAIAARQELQTIPGIGKDLAARIREFLQTGRLASYESLATPLPDQAKDWITLPGLTEPVVQHLYVRLGIRSLDDLEALTRSHLLRTLPGFAGSEEALLEAIAARKLKADGDP